MSKARLDALPKELIAHIATFAEPSTALNLSRTCRTARAAAWDPLIFKQILTTSQDTNWDKSTLDIEAIATTAGNDASTWAKFSIADEMSRRLAESIPNDQPRDLTPKHPLWSSKDYISFLPELFVVKHPFMACRGWETTVLCRRDMTPSQIFCLGMTVLATDENMIDVISILYTWRFDWFRAGSETNAYLWSLCNIALWARTQIKQRLAAWPYNDAARVPFIPIPKATQIPLRPFRETYNVPAPFSRRAAELLGRSTSSFSAWDSWYRNANHEKFRSPTYFTESSWCGYYIFFGSRQINVGIDAPMMDIQFEITGATHAEGMPSSLSVSAKDCIDGTGFFDLDGSIISIDDNVSDIKLLLRKQFQNRNVGYDWDCRLTPFGIVGFWGIINHEDNILRRQGLIWLWKRNWTMAA